MKAAGSIGANNPLRLRLLVMTWATPAPTSPSAGEPATKSGIAIGSGATLPSVICNFVCAPASEGKQQARSRTGAADQDVTAGERQRRKRKRRHGHCWLISKIIIHCGTSAWDRNRCPCISTGRRSRLAASCRAGLAGRRERRHPPRPDSAASFRSRPPAGGAARRRSGFSRIRTVT